MMNSEEKKINLVDEILKRLGKKMLPNYSSRKYEYLLKNCIKRDEMMDTDIVEKRKVSNLLGYYLEENIKLLYGKVVFDANNNDNMYEVNIERRDNVLVLISIFDDKVYEISFEEKDGCKTIKCVSSSGKDVFRIDFNENKMCNQIMIENNDDLQIHSYAYDCKKEEFSYRHERYNDGCRGILCDGSLSWITKVNDYEKFAFVNNVPEELDKSFLKRLITSFKKDNFIIDVRTEKQMVDITLYVDIIFEKLKSVLEKENKEEKVLKQA